MSIGNYRILDWIELPMSRGGGRLRPGSLVFLLPADAEPLLLRGVIEAHVPKEPGRFTLRKKDLDSGNPYSSEASQ